MNSAVPARDWRLSAEGRRRCLTLAQNLLPYAPAIIVSSLEPKAAETASLMADYFRLPFAQVAGLHEHDRSNSGFLPPDEFKAAVEAFFAHPDELVMGQETAVQAQTRFIQAVEGVIARSSGGGNIALVAHGTVITLFVAAYNRIVPFPFWQSLSLPSYTVLDLPRFELVGTFSHE
jgi:broad specificity phosphatase PhoE